MDRSIKYIIFTYFIGCFYCPLAVSEGESPRKPRPQSEYRTPCKGKGTRTHAIETTNTPEDYITEERRAAQLLGAPGRNSKKRKYRTPHKGIKAETIEANTQKSDHHGIGVEAIVKRAKQLPGTPAGAKSKPHWKKEIVQGTPTTQAAARLRRYNSKKERQNAKRLSPSAWLERYGIVIGNQKAGGRGEQASLAEFGDVQSNNTGATKKIPVIIRNCQGNEETVTTRPDSITQDKYGNWVIFEVKSVKPSFLLCATRQLRAQEQAARIVYEGRHVVSLRCPKCTNRSEFPKPRPSFVKRWEMKTEFRFTSPLGDRPVYRWVWDLCYEDDDWMSEGFRDAPSGFWKRVEESEDYDTYTQQ